ITLLSLLLFTPLLLHAEIILAENSTTDYQIVYHGELLPDGTVAHELASYLHQITGASFPVRESRDNRPENAGNCIYIGWQAPNDIEPLVAYERRIKSFENDIYIYGHGMDGHAFAVYDFLEHFLSCRFYTVRGIEHIPQNPHPGWDHLDYSVVPSFHAPHLYSGTWALAPEPLERFARKSRTYILRSGITVLGPDYYHVPGKLIPPGEKYQKQVGVWVPYRVSAGESYFEDHPEYFAMNPQGKRIPNRQLCYSHPELRKLFIAKLEQIVQEEYHGGQSFQWCDLNDNNGFDGKTICCCPECMALVEKYHSPAGPYWDFLLEVSRHYQEKYPSITLITTAYLATEKPPEGIAEMPPNVLVKFCPLNKNYMKPYDHPSNQRIVERLRQWNALHALLSVQLYPSVYPRFTSILPLNANLRQLAQNLRVCHQYGVKYIEAEQGYPWHNVNAFNEIRQYMLTKLFNDITLDENELIADAMHELYGAAAPTMIRYWQELEDLEAAETVGLTWNGCGFGVFSYLAAENLLRWNHDFDTMEALVADDLPRLNAVRDARVNLDETLLSVHDRLPDLPELSPEHLAERVRREVSRAFDERPRKPGVKDWTKFRDYVLNQRFANGIDYFLSLTQTPRPLPEPLTQLPLEQCHRILPIRMIGSENSHLHHLQPDGKAAFGVALPCDRKNLEKLRVTVVGFFEPSGKKYFASLNDAHEIPRADFEGHLDVYYAYYVGSSRLWPQSYLSIFFLDTAGQIPLGQFYSDDAPEDEYDFYLSAKLDDQGIWWLDQLILVRRQGAPRPQKTFPEVASD
ncbi:MAG: DUF4838 domain-containing protein, partial [Victivallales bacterium]|nr:DUF4838 domain-containing protein [Victivallales bacterium]